MARGGYRPGAGRPRKGETKKDVATDVARREARKAALTPLEYMLDVMNDAGAEDGRRDRMAIAAAPFVHARKEGEAVSKKAERQAKADEAAKRGKFGVPSSPKLVVNNRE